MSKKGQLCDSSECTGCMNCLRICRANAIKIQKNNLGFSYPIVDVNKCIKCNKCTRVCHLLHPLSKNSPIMGYKFIGADEERLKSSSGAFFPFIAKQLLSYDYNVVGVIFDDDYLSDRYCITKSSNIIDKMRKSKYIEADLGDIFEIVEKYLNQGQKVFFVGLPCHVAALLKYVKTTKNLITMDLICFGVGSQQMYKNSLMNFLKSNKYELSELKSVDFRHKPFINATHTIIDIEMQDKVFTLNSDQFPYYYGFVNRIILRECCYSCQYNSFDRVSDITIGDVAGNEDALGQNVVLCNTEKGKKVIDSLPQDHGLIKLTSEEFSDNRLRFIRRYKPKYYDKVLKCKNYTKIEKKFLRNKKHKMISKKVIKQIKQLIKH